MAGLTDAYENRALEHFFRNNPQTPDAALFAALFTTSPAESGGSGVEVAAGDYARQPLAFGPSVAGRVENTGLLNFANAAASAWGTVTTFGIYNALTAGALVAFGAMVTPLVVGAGSPVSFAAGRVSFTAPGSLSTPYRDRLNEHFLRNNPQAPDAQLWHAMYLAEPLPDGTGGTEVSAPWYARRPVSFSAAASGSLANAATVSHVQQAAAAAGTIRFSAFVNAAGPGAGLVVFQTPFSVALAAEVGSTIEFATGQLSVSFD